MPAGYSGTPLARKLGIRTGHRLATLHAPDHLPGLLDPLPGAVAIEPDPAPVSGPGAGYDVVIVFVSQADALEERLDRARRLLAWNGGLWVAWPKKSSALHRDLAREAVREAGLDTGLVDNKVCAIDDDWSGLRFVYRAADRPG
jgi:hypothetical protein